VISNYSNATVRKIITVCSFVKTNRNHKKKGFNTKAAR